MAGKLASRGEAGAALGSGGADGDIAHLAIIIAVRGCVIRK